MSKVPKRQTRRSISVKGITYQRMKDYCDDEGKSVSGFIEELIATRFDELGIPEPTVLRPPDPKPSSPKTSDEIISQHFTF